MKAICKESDLEFHPVTYERWNDLVDLFEHKGNPGYCWCMSWRLSSKEFQHLGSEGRKDALKEMVLAGIPIGIVAYQNEVPVGWCSVAPRKTYARLQRSAVLKLAPDDSGVWSIVCFFIDRKMRKQHLMHELLKAAIKYARSQGAQTIEAYPVQLSDDNTDHSPNATSYSHMGFVPTFKQEGFIDIGPAGKHRRVMQLVLNKDICQ
jgi:GNAT superfamily N-acetyltransferase